MGQAEPACRSGRVHTSVTFDADEDPLSRFHAEPSSTATAHRELCAFAQHICNCFTSVVRKSCWLPTLTINLFEHILTILLVSLLRLNGPRQGGRCYYKYSLFCRRFLFYSLQLNIISFNKTNNTFYSINRSILIFGRIT